jgi:WD40 repeat protein
VHAERSSNSGAPLYRAGQLQLKRWRIDDGTMNDQNRYVATGALTALAVNPTNELVVVGGRELLRVLRLEDEQFRQTLNLYGPENNKLSALALADVKWSSPSAGNLIATASTAGIAIYDLAMASSQKLNRVISEHTRAVNRVHFHPTDSFLLLSGSQDGTIKVWGV